MRPPAAQCRQTQVLPQTVVPRPLPVNCTPLPALFSRPCVARASLLSCIPRRSLSPVSTRLQRFCNALYVIGLRGRALEGPQGLRSAREGAQQHARWACSLVWPHQGRPLISRRAAGRLLLLLLLCIIHGGLLRPYHLLGHAAVHHKFLACRARAQGCGPGRASSPEPAHGCQHPQLSIASRPLSTSAGNWQNTCCGDGGAAAPVPAWCAPVMNPDLALSARNRQSSATSCGRPTRPARCQAWSGGVRLPGSPLVSIQPGSTQFTLWHGWVGGSGGRRGGGGPRRVVPRKPGKLSCPDESS